VERHAQPRRASLGRDPDDGGTVLVIAAEAAERKVMRDAGTLELDARAVAQIAGPEPDRERVAAGQRVEQRRDAGEHPKALRARHLLREREEVGFADRVDGGVVHGGADSLETAADDGAVGHAVKTHAIEGFAVPVALAEHAGDGAAPG